MKTLKKGFTLIELLVVIAIIAILATMVFVSVAGVRVKANDTAVKAQLSSMAAAAETQADTDGNYANACTTIVATKITTAKTAGGYDGKCFKNGANTAWAVSAPLSVGFWCNDSLGNNKSIAANLTTVQTACPAI